MGGGRRGGQRVPSSDEDGVGMQRAGMTLSEPLWATSGKCAGAGAASRCVGHRAQHTLEIGQLIRPQGL